jgi:AraC family transcriptional regulator, melibiose operon regulatory protein
MTSFDPNRPTFASYGFTCELLRPTHMPRPDQHNEIEVNFIVAGSVTYLIGGQRVRIPAMQFTAFWAVIPHQIVDFDSGSEYYVATLPLAWFLQCRPPEALVKALLQGEVVTEDRPDRGASDHALLASWAADMAASNELLCRAVRLELEARLIRLADSAPALGPRLTGQRRKTSSQGGLNRVESMACYIAQNYTKPLSVNDIAQIVHLHPNYAISLFRKTFGITLLNYITNCRISHAQRLLITTDDKVLHIAMRSGFGSASRFNAAFLEHCECSPRQYREQRRGDTLPVVEPIERHRYQNHHALDRLLPERRHVQQERPVVQHADDQTA